MERTYFGVNNFAREVGYSRKHFYKLIPLLFGVKELRPFQIEGDRLHSWFFTKQQIEPTRRFLAQRERKTFKFGPRLVRPVTKMQRQSEGAYK